MNTPWWDDDEVILLNNKYEPEPNAKASLRDASIIGIYFGAYSNRATRVLTKFVKKFHAEIRSRTTSFQIIFCSMDDNERDCRDFVQSLHGDWLVIPWDDEASRRTAVVQCRVSVHPALAILRNEESGVLVSNEGKEEFQEMGQYALEYWEELAVAGTPSASVSELLEPRESKLQ